MQAQEMNVGRYLEHAGNVLRAEINDVARVARLARPAIAHGSTIPHQPIDQAVATEVDEMMTATTLLLESIVRLHAMLRSERISPASPVRARSPRERAYVHQDRAQDD